ncbi:DNA/RNA non-specific endonuclease, partial [Staphylococcus aureus]|uniref:DNA/RNA non-specific endonuclease n=1 Tax=Staphylococcus aureus TaxID=1280 RepID=UPI003D0A6A4C
MWSASNVDYSDALRDTRNRTELGNGAWRLDKRIPALYQIQAHEFYDPATLVDKGHIVRRDDNCWA